MNPQILDAIKKKAEDYVNKDCPMPTREDYMSNKEWDEILTIAGVQILAGKMAYTSGQVDAIEMMIKNDGFIMWKDFNCELVYDTNQKKYLYRYQNDKYTLEQLLLKYMEENKL